MRLKDAVVDHWMTSQKEYEKQDPKMVYYLSMEFLMGRALGNNIINLQAYKPVKDALDELGVDLNVIEDQEPDPALGNGGLGRLAACFLDSLATLGYSAYGCGIRYRYGMFKQQIRDGYQIEVPDNWLENGNPFELRRPEYAKEVKFGGYVNVYVDENGTELAELEFSDGRRVEYGSDELEMVEHAYATTVHKSQGSEYPMVILPWLPMFYKMLRRNIFYTAVTRAGVQVAIIGSKRAVCTAIHNTECDRRNTRLGERVIRNITGCWRKRQSGLKMTDTGRKRSTYKIQEEQEIWIP